MQKDAIIQTTPVVAIKWLKDDYSDNPRGSHKMIKGPTHMVEGAHHLRKAPNPHLHIYSKKLLENRNL